MNKKDRAFFLWIFIGYVVIFSGSAIVTDLANWVNWITLAIAFPVYFVYLVIIFRAKS